MTKGGRSQIGSLRCDAPQHLNCPPEDFRSCRGHLAGAKPCPNRSARAAILPKVSAKRTTPSRDYGGLQADYSASARASSEAADWIGALTGPGTIACCKSAQEARFRGC